MTTINDVEPGRVRLILWTAQLLSVVMMTALAWWLPPLGGPSAGPDMAFALLMVAVAAVPFTVLLARLLGVGAADGAGYSSRYRQTGPRPAGGLQAAGASAVSLGHYIAVIVLAELPIVLGLVYVILGGARPNALMLGAGSVILLLLYRPGQRSSVGAVASAARR